MRTLLSTVLLTALLGLTACEPKGPAADIGDNIDQVMDNQTTPKAEPNTNGAADTANTGNASAPESKVIEQQKEELATATQEASKEAEQRLNEILEDTLDQP